ncbi:MAG: hypothetical protein EHM60_05485 [Lysobacterales bacterium]|nr:MAG: hypothetical protein EHM60_05485 [Xanthomonadales bacterium]
MPTLAPLPDTESAHVAEAERLLRLGEPLLAYNVAETGLGHWPGSLRLKQLLGLALTRSGDLERAYRVLAELADAGVDDAETIGVLARIHKDLGVRARDSRVRHARLGSAFELYSEAYAKACREGPADSAYYTGINAATVAVLRGELDEARWLAAEVRSLCHSLDAEPRSLDEEYWRQATLGEAALILADGPAAARHFAAAMALGAGRYGNLSSTRRQARLLAERLPLDGRWLDDVLRIPPVLAFTGHMIDAAGRERPRFPAALEPSVRAAIDARLRAHPPLAAYGSAACGADLLCLEAVQSLGGEVHVVLPYPAAEFRRSSVEIGGPDWVPRYDRLLETADTVTIASDHRASGSLAPFEYANLLITGLAQLRSQVLETELRGLAIWDPSGGGAPGGTASVVDLWRRRGYAVDEVLLAALRAPQTAPAPTGGPAAAIAPPAPVPGVASHRLKALLFADAVGYSQLTEDQIPRYVESFLGEVAALNRRTTYRHEHVETAGDGLYMVFSDAVTAAHYALELNSLANGTDWTRHGLPASFNLRIALHCGPVYCGRDPVTGSPLYTGPHTSRAARIEPITPPGQVYASSAFAAVAAAAGASGIAMRYVGTIPLAKRSGSQALYHLHLAD